MLKHALPCQWNSIHFSFSTRWGWFNAYFSIVWLNQGMLLQNTLKQTNKKRLSHTEMQTQTGKENYYFTCIDGSSEYIDGFYRNEPCGRQRRRLRLEQSLQPGTWNINYYNSIILVKRTNLRPLNGMSGAGSASFLPIFVFSDRKKLQNFRFISKMKIDNSWLYVETDESVCIVADFGIKTKHWRRWLQMFIPVTRQFGISWSFPFHTTLISQQIGEVTQACQSMSIWKQDPCDKKIALLLWPVSSFLVALLSADKHSKAKPTMTKRLRTENIEPISFVEKTLENTKACI